MKILNEIFNHNFQFHSNKCNENSIFIALETGQKSGTDFAQDAIKNGAIAVISQKPINKMQQISYENFSSNLKNVNIVVEDSLLFIQNLARQKFDYLKQNGTKTVAITGSVGKTTTKELVSYMLQKYGKTHYTQGNYNNHIGLPITILNAPNDTKHLVLEMGMSHAGEIELLTSIAPCQWNVITNAGESHSANFEDGKDGVLKAKFEILSSNGKCFVLKNLHEKFLQNKYLTKKYPNAQIFITDPNPKISYKENNTVFNFNGQEFEMNDIYSRSQVEMFCLAISLVENIVNEKITNISVGKFHGRGNIIKWKNISITNESYNAAPASMQSALENFQKIDGKKLCILGEMREIENSKFHHEKLAQYFHLFDAIYTVGPEFEGIYAKNLKYFQNYASLLNFLKVECQITNFDAILVKASNGVMLYKLFDEFFV